MFAKSLTKFALAIGFVSLSPSCFAQNTVSAKSNSETKTCTCGNYQFSIPNRFEFTKTPRPPGMPENIQIFVWRDMKDETTPNSLVVITLLTDERSAKEATEDMRQTLVNMSVGTLDQMRIKIDKRGATKEAKSGLKVKAFHWAGSMPNYPKLGGTAAGTVQGNELLVMQQVVFEGDLRKETSEVLNHFARVTKVTK